MSHLSVHPLSVEKQTLRLENIRLKRGARLILDKVELEIAQGELVLMTGQNGSGKSTLLKIVAGLLKPDQARIIIHPHDGQKRAYNWPRMKKVLRQKICYLHQQPYLFHGSVFENVAYGLKRQSVAKDQIRQKVVQVLEDFALIDLIERDCRELSGGEKQRVAIVRSWITQPDIMLLDEPFSNMDKESRKKSYTLINHLCQENIAIVLTSHDPLLGELNFSQHVHLFKGNITRKPV